MPRIASGPDADRIWARLDHFETECPNCAELIATSHDRRQLPARLATLSRQRSEARRLPKNATILKLTWNPLTQRLVCPSCATVYICGLLLYPVRPGSRRPYEAPPDTMITRREQALLRRNAGGWYARQQYSNGQPVNQASQATCLCDQPPGLARQCPIHASAGGPPA